jgi:hypothetical protein
LTGKTPKGKKKGSARKSGLKRDGPVFFSSAPVKVAGDERTIMAIVAPHRGETLSSEALREGGEPI